MRLLIVDDIKLYDKETNAYVHDVLAGRRQIDKERAERTIVMTPESFAAMFTPQRIRLILRIKRNRISNIYQIAKELGRKYEAVHRDIKFLRGWGIIRMHAKGRTRIPTISGPIRIPALAA